MRVLHLELMIVVLLIAGAAIASIRVVPLPERPEIPSGHLPPPGECRIWMPDQPPGQQDPPGECRELATRVPSGAWLIYRATPDVIGISAYSVEVPDLVGELRYYDARTLERLPNKPAALPAANLEVPRGHLPPPGTCRLWFPGRPPGQQPSPSSCSRALDGATPGAWVLHRISADRVAVIAYHPEVPGVVLEMEVFDIRR